MVNKKLFSSSSGSKKLIKNNAGGIAHEFNSEHKLAQIALTGTFSNTYYVTAKTQLEEILKLGNVVESQFIGKLAIYARKHGFMKDTPALLAAIIANRDPHLFEKIVPSIIDNGRMIRNLVQIFRSGQVSGRKNIPKPAKWFIHDWLNNRSYYKLLDDSVGENPSLKDVIKMVHPKPADKTRAAAFGYLSDNSKFNYEDLPQHFKNYEDFKKLKGQQTDPAKLSLASVLEKVKNAKSLFEVQKLVNRESNQDYKIPNVEFRLLTALNLSTKDWTEIALNGGWHMVRMNLNTFARHKVFEDSSVAKKIAEKISDRNAILKSRVMPYQLLIAFLNTENSSLPSIITNALQDALEISLENVQKLEGKGFIFPDISGSMKSKVAEKSVASCLDVATLTAAAFLRKNPEMEIIPFSDDIVPVKLNPRDSIVTNAKKLAMLPSGGTNISAPLSFLNKRKEKDLNTCIFVSDNESWIDSAGFWYSTKTAAEKEWQILKEKNSNAKLICIDITPNSTTQCKEKPDVFNIGGFSDIVFKMIDMFTRTGVNWVSIINEIDINKFHSESETIEE